MDRNKYNKELKQIKIEDKFNNVDRITVLSENALKIIVTELYPDQSPDITKCDIYKIIDCSYENGMCIVEYNNIGLFFSFSIEYFKDTTGITFTGNEKYYDIDQYMDNIVIKPMIKINYI